MIAAFFMVFISHWFFLSLDECKEGKCYGGITPIVLISLANTMIQLTLYPQVNYLVKEKYFGTAYGIIESACNLGLFAGSFFISLILNNHRREDEPDTLDIH